MDCGLKNILGGKILIMFLFYPILRILPDSENSIQHAK